MRILMIDNHPVGREEIKALLTEMLSGAENIDDTFTNGKRKKIIDRIIMRCFPDEEENTISSREFAAFFKEVFPDTKIVFVNEKKNPDDREVISVKPEPYASQKSSRLQIQTFGNFEVFINGDPVHFKYSRTKELLAYLIDRRGAMCTNGELISTLWGDASASRKHYLKNLKRDLRNVLEEGGCQDAVVQHKGLIGILPQNVCCDYYDYLEGKEEAVSLFQGEYMSQYSWSENTLGFLDRMSKPRIRQR